MDVYSAADRDEATIQKRPRKRARTAVACARCKSRKQKCDGLNPSCSNCAGSRSLCEYDLSQTLNRSQEQYFKARRRVEELESLLSRLGGTQENAVLDDSPLTCSPEFTGPGQGQGEPTMTSASTQQQIPERKDSKTSDCVDVLNQLSVQAAGGYVDSSSTATLGRMLQEVITPTKPPDNSPQGSLLDQNLSPKSLEVVALATTVYIPLSIIPAVVADRMLEKGYFGYISLLWPLMDPYQLRDLHARRASLKDGFDIAALHLVYATAGRFLETTGETGSFRSEQHYQTAATLVPEILSSHDLRSVQILLLLAIYSLRAPKGPGAWFFVGMAMRMCIELGLHRKKCSDHESEADQLQLRVFWSCYCLDRQVSIILGRPFAVSDRDIDADLPLSTPEDAFVFICKLRKIESDIQQSIHRADQLDDASNVRAIQCFIERLEDWRSSTPTSTPNNNSASIDTCDSYLIYYYQAIRYLLHPHVMSPHAQSKYIKAAVDACGGICQTYKRLHQNVTVGFSLMALHSVFFAGLTVLYCAWRSPLLVLTNVTRSMLNDTSIVLYIITERWPGAKRYRDLFEEIKDAVLQSLEQHYYRPQVTVEQLQPEVHGALKSICPAQNRQDDFSTMLMEMSGGLDASGACTQQMQYQISSNSTGVTPFVPGLAFDFSLPTEMETDKSSNNFYSWDGGIDTMNSL